MRAAAESQLGDAHLAVEDKGLKAGAIGYLTNIEAEA